MGFGMTCSPESCMSGLGHLRLALSRGFGRRFRCGVLPFMAGEFRRGAEGRPAGADPKDPASPYVGGSRPN